MEKELRGSGNCLENRLVIYLTGGRDLISPHYDTNFEKRRMGVESQ